MATTTDPTEWLPLTPAVLHILLALAGGERHGYGIMREIVEQTQGALHMGPGTLYGSIKRMLASALIEESAERLDPEHEDIRRRYYRLNDLGERVLQAEMQRLNHILHLPASQRLLGKFTSGTT